MRPALVLTLAIVPAALGGRAADAIDVAVVRGDGTLQPLARLDGGRWTAAVPAQAAGDWRLWLFDDPVVRESPFAMRAARPVTASGDARGPGCVAASGVDAAWAPAPAGRAGIALRGPDLRPDLPASVPIDSDFGRQLAARAAPAFHRAEDETLTVEAEELPAGFPRFAARRQRPIAWTKIVRQGVAQGATKTYYLEGSKDYAGFRGRTDIGQIRTTGHVFIRAFGDRETIDAEVDLSDADGRQSVFRTVLAMLTWPARAVWLFAARSHDGTRLELIEVTAGANRPRPVWQGPDGCSPDTR